MKSKHLYLGQIFYELFHVILFSFPEIVHHFNLLKIEHFTGKLIIRRKQIIGLHLNEAFKFLINCLSNQRRNVII